jgi:dihydropteroate synthase
MILKMRDRAVTFPRRPLVMGIVNITDDSFCGDGSLQIEQAIKIARRHITAGADMIDVGGESARTDRSQISAEEESARVLPFLSRFEECHEGKKPVDEMQIFPPLLSINTWRPEVAESTLQVGGHLLNDMSALASNENARIAARYRTGLVMMHSVGLPKQRHTHVLYADILRTMASFFDQQINQAIAAGVAREAIVLDPGLDFAKQKTDNLRIFRELKFLKHFERPILLPVSRKTVIGDVLGIADPSDRDAGTIACVVAGTLRGASIFRVHNVRAVIQALRTIYPIVSRPSVPYPTE